MVVLKNTYDDLHIDAGTSLTMIDQYNAGSGTKTISVGAGAQLTYLVLIREGVELDLRIESAGEGAQILVKGLLICKQDSDIKLRAHAHLMHDQSSADLHLVSLLQDGSVCEVDGGVDLHEGCAQISGHLLEENIILGSDIQIKTLPMLDVRSSDVSASHGCRIQQLDPQKLFYMRSKGLSKTLAEELMIRGYVEQVFAVMQGDDVGEIQKECIDYLLS